jgi:hypothetical protein
MGVKKDGVLHLKSRSIDIRLKDKAVPYQLTVITFTDAGIQICELVNAETDLAFAQSLVDKINSSKLANATLL